MSGAEPFITSENIHLLIASDNPLTKNLGFPVASGAKTIDAQVVIRLLQDGTKPRNEFLNLIRIKVAFEDTELYAAAEIKEDLAHLGSTTGIRYVVRNNIEHLHGSSWKGA
jgi:hypothetical protein